MIEKMSKTENVAPPPRGKELVAMRDDLLAVLKEYESLAVLPPEAAEICFKLGRLEAELACPEAAERCYRKALAIQPACYEAANNLGTIVVARKEFAEAEMLFRKALAGCIDYYEAHFNLGCLLQKQERSSEACYSFSRALALRPDSVEAANQLGGVLMDMGRLQDAMNVLRGAIERDSKSALAWLILAACQRRACNIDAAEAAYRQSLTCAPDYFLAWQGLLLSLNYACRDKAEIFALHRACGEQIARGKTIVPHANPMDPVRRLRVGFVSGDLRRHSVSYFVYGCISRMDRGQFELWAYFNHPRPDARTAEFKSHFYGWRDIHGLDDADVVRQIREDRIDILIDLSGHTGFSRLPVFADKPAPVQVTWVGYPNTTGLPQIDYRLTDGFADPEGEADAFSVERLWRLPHSFLCYTPAESTPSVAEAPCLTKGYVTFGSFGNRIKMVPECIALWAKVLRAVPDSRFLIKSVFGLDEAAAREAIRAQFAEHGISPDRIRTEIATNSLESHLEMYKEIDIALDTFPYHGTTTTCEALWMGVPVVCRVGDRHVSRVGVSLLGNAGLADLIAEDDEQFVQIACQLAEDFDTLNTIRGALRGVLESSRLMDVDAMTNDFSSALRQMWEIHCETHAIGGDCRPDVPQKTDRIATAMPRLIIGGNGPCEGWQVFASAPGDGIDFDGNLSNLNRFGSESYSEIYCAHVIQRLAQADVIDYLKSLYRMLCPGGKLYLSVPDLDILAWLLIAPGYSKADKFQFMRELFGRQMNLLDFNNLGLNVDFLGDFLREAGFARVEHVESFGMFDDASESRVDSVSVSLNLVAFR